jgi:hypothetical protein
MLEIRPVCENCKKELPYNSTDAYICSFECTYCRDCAIDIFENVCPNCGGGFVQRPVRPKKYLEKYPPSNAVIYRPADLRTHQETFMLYKNVPAEER